MCAKCIEHDYGSACSTKETSYDYALARDKTKTGINGMTIHCVDPVGSCQRSLCECDKTLIYELKPVIDQYQSENHEFNGFELRV